MKSPWFHALVIETTHRCNARCAMCYESAGPRGSEMRGTESLPLDVALRVIDEASQLDALGPRVHLSGGEVFLDWDGTLCLLRRAAERGFSNIGATTNGFWAGSAETAARRCAELARVGVTYLEVSADRWHQEFVDVERIRHLLRAARGAGIRIMLRTLATRSHRADEALAALGDADLTGVVIGNSRLYPVGRAAAEIAAEDVRPGGEIEGGCERMLNLTIAPNGNVYPCCAGSDMTEALAAGNVHRDSLAQALLKMSTDRMIRQVLHQGVGSLVPILEKLGHRDRLPEQPACLCHLCWSIFRQDDLAAALRQHFEDEQLQALIAFVQGLGAAAKGGAEAAPEAVG
jgi:MoaA/NifB/PqqE/SkfB family radical SAM enzyme